jgi:hypothetical protein
MQRHKEVRESIIVRMRLVSLQDNLCGNNAVNNEVEKLEKWSH